MAGLTISPVPGASGAAVVRLPAGERDVTFEACDALHTLDLCGGVNVETLDLSALPDDLMLYARDLPALRHLVLPRGAGCHLHLALGAPPALRIDGDMSWLDACWPRAGGEGKLSASWNEHASALRPRVLRGAWLGTTSGAPTDVALLALCDDPSTVLDLTPHQAACVVVEEAPALTHLVADTHQLLLVRSAPALLSVTCRQVAAACVEDALALERLVGDGTQVSLRDSARVETLQVDGAWGEFFLHREGPKRLVAPGVRRFHAELVHRLRLDNSVMADKDPTTARESLPAERALEEAIQDLVAGSSLTTALKQMFVQAAQKLGPQRSLEALAGSVALLEDARRVDFWALRMVVARSQRKKSTKGSKDSKDTKDTKKGASWSWEFAPDLADRGWRADLRLWQHCRSVSASARDFEAVLRKSSDPDHIAAVADAARDPENARVNYIGILGAQLKAGLTEGPYLPARPEKPGAARVAMREQLQAASSPHIIQALQVTLRALVRMRERPEVPLLVDQLCDWLVHRLPNGSGIQTLAAMHSLGARRAATSLATLVALPTLRSELRHEALMASLVTPRQDYLGFKEPANVG
jgi:hypothetical protein